MKKTVLFVCIHNSARSQMAEAWLNHLHGDRFVAESAGIEAGRLNPLAVEAMREVGIDISHKQPRKVFDVCGEGRLFTYVVTVCDEASAERCPVFPGPATRLHWSFPDPATLIGNPEEQREQTRQIRDRIRAQIEGWCGEVEG